MRRPRFGRIVLVAVEHEVSVEERLLEEIVDDESLKPRPPVDGNGSC